MALTVGITTSKHGKCLIYFQGTTVQIFINLLHDEVLFCVLFDETAEYVPVLSLHARL